MVTGDAGIGKSTLIDTALSGGPIDRVRTAHPTMASSTTTAFGPWEQALGAERGPLPETLGTERAEISRAVVLTAWLGQLRSAMEDGPLAIVLDDLQWADDASLDLLAAVATSVTDGPLLVVVAVRAEAESPRLDELLEELLRRPSVSLIHLEALADHELSELLVRTSPPLGDPENAMSLQRLLDESGSNTFWALELARSFPSTAPARLRELILRPFHRLDGPARAVVELLALSGKPVSAVVLDSALATEGHRRPGAVPAAVASGLVAATQDRESYRLTHGLTIAVIDAELSREERTMHHRALATGLSERLPADRVDAGELADHWFRGGEVDRALDWSVRAGVDALAKVATAQAELHLSRAMELWPRSSDPRDATAFTYEEIVRSRAEAARWAGDAGRAIALIDDALATEADAVARARLLERLGRFRYEGGDADGAEAAYAEAERTLGLDGARAEDSATAALAAQIVAARASLFMLAGHPRDAVAVATEAVALAERAGAERQAAYALSTLGTCRVELGEVERGMRDLLRSQKIARRLDDVEAILRAETCLCLAYDAQGRLVLSREAATRAFEVTRRFRLAGGMALSMAANVMELDWMVGEWEHLDELAALPYVSGAGQYESFLLVVRAQLQLARGHVDDATRLLEDAERLADHTQPVRYVSFLLARAQAELWQGRPSEALGFARDAIGALHGTEEPVMLGWSAALALRAAASLPRRGSPRGHAPAQALAALEIVARDAHRLPQAAAWLWTARGEVSRISREPDPVAWKEAERLWGAVGRPYERAYALWRMSEALDRTGSRSRAVEAVAEAKGIAERLGATALLGEIGEWAQRARLLRPDLPAQLPTAFSSLTQREFEVLLLMSGGASNKQIANELAISSRTVAVHVSNVLRKLRARSRTEAAMLAERAGLVGDGANRPG